MSLVSEFDTQLAHLYLDTVYPQFSSVSSPKSRPLLFLYFLKGLLILAIVTVFLICYSALKNDTVSMVTIHCFGKKDDKYRGI